MKRVGNFHIPAPRPFASAQVLFLYHAGGSAHSFYQAASSLPESLEGMIAELPGHGSRMSEQPAKSISELANQFCREVRDMNFDERLIIFGHSMGAIIGFELAHLLTNQARLPFALFVSAMGAPSFFHAARKTKLQLSCKEIEDQILEFSDSPDKLLKNERWRSTFLPILTNDHALVSNYCYDSRKKLSTPIYVLGGDADRSTQMKNVRPWENESSARTSFHFFSGGHFYFRKHLESIGSLLLEAARSPQEATS